MVSTNKSFSDLATDFHTEDIFLKTLLSNHLQAWDDEKKIERVNLFQSRHNNMVGIHNAMRSMYQVSQGSSAEGKQMKKILKTNEEVLKDRKGQVKRKGNEIKAEVSVDVQKRINALLNACV